MAGVEASSGLSTESVRELSGSFSQDVPNGPVTSTADTGTSFFRLLMFDLGRSKKRSDTSGGIDIAAPPIREWLLVEDEKVRL